MSDLVTCSLADCEAVIERGLGTFIEVGAALAEIRDAGLYREGFETFEDYCRDRWDFSRPRAYQLIDAAEMSTTVDTALPSERVARELAPLRDEPEQLRETWAEAVERHGERPTAKQVHVLVQERVVRPAPTSDYTQCPTCGHRLRRDQPRPVGGYTT